MGKPANLQEFAPRKAAVASLFLERGLFCRSPGIRALAGPLEISRERRTSRILDSPESINDYC
jgi:hypothetical protein